jgi:mono/diheme cytochrome c family protein
MGADFVIGGPLTADSSQRTTEHVVKGGHEMRVNTWWAFCVFLVVVALAGVAAAGAAGNAAKGKAKYQELCAACHGATGKGDGPAAAGLQTKPRNHTDAAYMNKLKDQEIFDMIKKGGQAMGKSPLMPGWATQLKDEEIRDLVVYIRTLAAKK